MIFYAGDTHGRTLGIIAIDNAARRLGVQVVVQTGDFGAFFQEENEGCQVVNYFNQRRPGGPVWYTCGGNHDNWPYWNYLAAGSNEPVELAKDCYFVPRGGCIELDGVKHVFFGGAESTDEPSRVEGLDWHREETPTVAETNRFFANIDTYQPEVVVTHEAPLRIQIRKMNRDSNPTPRNLENVCKHMTHKPRAWFFGHHHMVEKWTVDGVDFYCTGLEGAYVAR
jgi:hypothetical protein